jgi:hypothetical protein
MGFKSTQRLQQELSETDRQQIAPCTAPSHVPSMTFISRKNFRKTNTIGRNTTMDSIVSIYSSSPYLLNNANNALVNGMARNVNSIPTALYALSVCAVFHELLQQQQRHADFATAGKNSAHTKIKKMPHQPYKM